MDKKTPKKPMSRNQQILQRMKELAEKKAQVNEEIEEAQKTSRKFESKKPLETNSITAEKNQDPEKLKRLKNLKYKNYKRHLGDTSTSTDSAPETKNNLIRRSRLQEYLFNSYCKSHPKPPSPQRNNVSKSETKPFRKKFRNDKHKKDNDDDDDDDDNDENIENKIDPANLLHLKKPCIDEKNQSVYYDNHGRMDPIDWSSVDKKKVPDEEKIKPIESECKKEIIPEKSFDTPNIEFCNAVYDSIEDKTIFSPCNNLQRMRYTGDYSPLMKIDRMLQPDHPNELEVHPGDKERLNRTEIKSNLLDTIDFMSSKNNIQNENISESDRLKKVETYLEQNNFVGENEMKQSVKSSTNQKLNIERVKSSSEKGNNVKMLLDEEDDMFDFEKPKKSSLESSSNSSSITSSKKVKHQTSIKFLNKLKRLETLDSDDASSVRSDISTASSKPRFDSFKNKLLDPKFLEKSYCDMNQVKSEHSKQNEKTEFLMKEVCTRYFTTKAATLTTDSDSYETVKTINSEEVSSKEINTLEPEIEKCMATKNNPTLSDVRSDEINLISKENAILLNNQSIDESLSEKSSGPSTKSSTSSNNLKKSEDSIDESSIYYEENNTESNIEKISESSKDEKNSIHSNRLEIEKVDLNLTDEIENSHTMIICDNTEVKKSSVVIEEILDDSQITENITKKNEIKSIDELELCSDESDVYDYEGFDCVNIHQFAPFAALFNQLKSLKELKIDEHPGDNLLVPADKTKINGVNFNAINSDLSIKNTSNSQNISNPVIGENIFANVNVDDISLDNCSLHIGANGEPSYSKYLIENPSNKPKSSGRLNKMSNALKKYQNKKIN